MVQYPSIPVISTPPSTIQNPLVRQLQYGPVGSQQQPLHFSIKMKGDQLSFMIYLLKKIYKRVRSESLILKVLSIIEESRDILEADETIFHKLDN